MQQNSKNIFTPLHLNNIFAIAYQILEAIFLSSTINYRKSFGRMLGCCYRYNFTLNYLIFQ